MAITKIQDAGTNSSPKASGGVTPEQVQGAFNNAQEKTIASSHRSVGFGGVPGVELYTSNKGSEYTLNFAKGLNEYYAKASVGAKPIVMAFDKSIFQGFAYSYVTVAISNKNAVNYYIIVLEETGRHGAKVQDIAREIRTAREARNASSITVYTADDAVNSTLHRVVIEKLKEHFKGVETFVSVDGMIVPHLVTVEMFESRIPHIAARAANACLLDSGISTGEVLDLNVREERTVNKDARLRIDVNVNGAPAVNELGVPVRNDWQLALKLTTANNSRSLNVESGDKTIAVTGGYMDFIPQETNLISRTTGRPYKGVRFRPNVIITSTNIAYPTTGFALLSVVASTLMARPDMYLGTMTPKVGDKIGYGALNRYGNIEEHASGYGEVAETGSKKYTKEELLAFLQEIVSLEAVISMDIPAFGPETHFGSIFSAAAKSPQNQVESIAKTNAAREIINSAVRLTDGIFPRDFKVEDIFAHDAVVLPAGTWQGPSEARDIRDLDFAKVATQSNYKNNFMLDWVASALPGGINGLTPYYARLELIDTILPDAEIYSKYTRVTFSGKFIATLAQAVTQAGFDVVYEPIVNMVQQSNFGSVGTYYANAGISGQPSFAHQQTYSSFNMGNVYSGGGGYRYGR